MFGIRYFWKQTDKLERENMAHHRFKQGQLPLNAKINSVPTVFHLVLIYSSKNPITSIIFDTSVVCLRIFKSRVCLFIQLHR